ncbi:hypothetical protein M8494_21035 [Serratia ureilytica]
MATSCRAPSFESYRCCACGTLGCSLLGLVAVADRQCVDWTQAPLLADRLPQVGAALSLLGVAMGTLRITSPFAAPFARSDRLAISEKSDRGIFISL